jgi:AAA domain/Bifunctional DNA primase/polymerase, N-terminal
MSTNGYAAAYPIYRDRGWTGTIKLKARTKGVDAAGRPTVPAGFTGRNGADPSGADCLAWAQEEPDGNIAIRLPDGIIGIDIDNYGGKRGGETIAEAEKRWGRRPFSPRSSSRGDDPISGIRLYRIPPGVELDTIISFPELGLGGIEIIQRHHRFVVCWPSIHPEGRVYHWHGIDGGVLDEPPHPDDVPELPDKWLEGLRKTQKTNGTEFSPDDLYNVKDALTEGDPSPRVSQRLGVAMADLYSGACRHDTTRGHVLALLRYGEQGETGVERALLAYREAFANNVASNRPGGRAEAIGEFNDFVNGEKVARLLAEPGDNDWTKLIGNTAFDPGDAESGEHTDPDEPKVDAVESAIRNKLTGLRIDREARRRLDDENRPPIIVPPVKNLDTLLGEPDTVAAYRIEQLAPTDGRVILSAQFKAGKTTIVGNLMRALTDGDPFLGRFTVNTPAARLVLIDDELSENTLRRWLREQNIANTAAVADVITLRGKVASFNILDDRCRAIWAKRLRDLGCDYLILDCLRPVLDALGLDENRDAGKFLTPFDALLDEAGISDALLVQHMGHANERSRGDSRLQDWPEATWRLVRETDEPNSSRFFTAYGRDVDVPEGRLGFDPATRRLTYIEGSRGDAKTEAAMQTVIAILAEDAKTHGDGLSGRAIEEAVDGEHPQKAIRGAVKLATARGFVTTTLGAKRAKLHRIANPCELCGMPVVAGQGSRHEICARKVAA